MKIKISPVSREATAWLQKFERNIAKMPVKTQAFYFEIKKTHYICNFSFYPETYMSKKAVMTMIGEKLEKKSGKEIIIEEL